MLLGLVESLPRKVLGCEADDVERDGNANSESVIREVAGECRVDELGDDDGWEPVVSVRGCFGWLVAGAVVARGRSSLAVGALGFGGLGAPDWGVAVR